LRVQPGDTLVIHLKNEISLPPAPGGHAHVAKAGNQRRNPCDGGEMSPSSMNLHFHGLAIPPVCHQDETLKTVIQPGDPAFEYRVRIPKSQPPGLYWYHPHVHGFNEEQLLAGASGALIVGGTARAVSQVAGLPERVLVIRDEKMPAAAPDDKPDLNRPTKQISINNIRVPYPKYPTAVIKMKPGERQFWRVLNASADTYVNLAVEYDGKRQLLGLVSLDGVPLRFGEPDSEGYVSEQTNIFISPAGRAEFVITGPPEGVTGRLATFAMYRGADDDGRPVARRIGEQPALRIGQDDIDPSRPLATIVAAAEASTPKVPEASSGARRR
jgi:FtsP/CotA-like multicopper oxidase with cupredoxin domain